MAKSNAKGGQDSNSSFASDFAKGTVMGAFGAGVSLFVIKSCTGKRTGGDYFNRV